jgi:Leucine-rich repeat (LRR) protein
VRPGIALILLFLTVSWLAINHPAAALNDQPERVARFPDSVSLGRLYLIAGDRPIWAGLNARQERGEARGQVTVPGGCRLILSVGEAVQKNPSLLIGCGPKTFDGLDFVSSGADDKMLGKISGLSGLQVLILDGAKISDHGLEALSALRNLQYISFSGASISDRGLERLLQSGSLVGLSLVGTKIGVNGLKGLENCREMQFLNLHATKVDDNGLKIVGRCRNLRWLALNQTDVTDSGLKNLANCRALSFLSLAGCSKVSGAGLACLDNMPALARLDLSQTKVTASGLAPLKCIRHLIVLNISETGITASDLDKLKQPLSSPYTLYLQGKSFTDAALNQWHNALPAVTIRVMGAKAPDRILHFPERVSLGKLLYQPQYASLLADKTKLGKAQGAVTVPKLANLWLEVGYAAAQDPSLLTAYSPDFFAGLDLRKVEIDDATLAKWAALKGLQALDLTDAGISDLGLKSLSGLNKLAALDLTGTLITNQGLASLATLPALTFLTLDRTKIGDKGLPVLQQCHHLQNLSLSRCSITDDGLASIAKCQDLHNLVLNYNPQITAKSLLRLSSLKQLNYLSVRTTGLTAADLPVIQNLCRQLPYLSRLAVRDKSFTEAAIRQWQQALPNVTLKGTGNEANKDLQQEAPILFAPVH